jgi:small-conductance mechanosensitive channel
MHRVPFVAARLVLGGVFLFAGIPKLARPHVFLGDVYEFQMTGPAVSRAVAMFVPAVECIIGVALLTGVLLSSAFLLSAGMLTLFAVVQLLVISRGLQISCGCFGRALSGQVNYTSVALNTALAITACLACGYTFRTSYYGASSKECRA